MIQLKIATEVRQDAEVKLGDCASTYPYYSHLSHLSHNQAPSIAHGHQGGFIGDFMKGFTESRLG
ncbi:MAG TPA: hypothetical protein V6C57_20530 [Coleofasciculaceae cyanobacterium]